MARQAFAVNEAVRERVRHLAGVGVRQDDIARIIGCAPKTLRKRLRDEINYRAQVGYTRYFLPGRFYRGYDMPNAWPWALHPLMQAPAILIVDTLRRHSPAVQRLQDRYARWRRESWWRNEMGEAQSHFKPAEQFRRRT